MHICLRRTCCIRKGVHSAVSQSRPASLCRLLSSPSEVYGTPTYGVPCCTSTLGTTRKVLYWMWWNVRMVKSVWASEGGHMRHMRLCGNSPCYFLLHSSFQFVGEHETWWDLGVEECGVAYICFVQTQPTREIDVVKVAPTQIEALQVDVCRHDRLLELRLLQVRPGKVDAVREIDFSKHTPLQIEVAKIPIRRRYYCLEANILQGAVEKKPPRTLR